VIDCGGLVGTYLTKNSVGGGSQRLSSRSLISLTGSGQIFFTDSGEGGEANLTKACVNALIAAGDISKEYVDRQKELLGR
jgi:hypothetical protein